MTSRLTLRIGFERAAADTFSMSRAGLTKWLGIASRVAAGILLLVGVLLLVAHARFARNLVLASLERNLATYGIEARAERLDYNLLTLDVRLTGLSLSRRGQRASPFFFASAVHLKLPAHVLTGGRAVERLEIVEPRVLLRRASDGQINWPETASRAPAGVPSRLDLGELVVRDLDVSLIDER